MEIDALSGIEVKVKLSDYDEVMSKVGELTAALNEAKRLIAELGEMNIGVEVGPAIQ